MHERETTTGILNSCEACRGWAGPWMLHSPEKSPLLTHSSKMHRRAKPQLCITMCKSIWRSSDRHEGGTCTLQHQHLITGLCNFYRKKCRKTSSPKIEIGQVRVDSQRPQIFLCLNYALPTDARPQGHQATDYKARAEKKAHGRLLQVLIHVYTNSTFGITCTDLEYVLLR